MGDLQLGKDCSSIILCGVSPSADTCLQFKGIKEECVYRLVGLEALYVGMGEGSGLILECSKLHTLSTCISWYPT